MEQKNRTLIGLVRSSSWSRLLLFVLTLNFINLSANFYEGDILLSDKVNLTDPVDTISELVFEWGFDVSEDFIPDNGTQQEANAGEKIKLAIVEVPGFSLWLPLVEGSRPALPAPVQTSSGHLSSPSPPPDWA